MTLITHGRRRGREVDAAISEGRCARADERVLALVALMAAVGGMLLVVLILIGR